MDCILYSYQGYEAPVPRPIKMAKVKEVTEADREAAEKFKAEGTRKQQPPQPAAAAQRDRAPLEQISPPSLAPG